MRPSMPLLLGLSAFKRAAIPSTVDTYPAHNFSVPLDHFPDSSRYEPHSHDLLNLRYWYDASYYQPGGPVFVIGAGETDGEDRFPFLSQGIVTQLAETYHGLGVILEHRYYGQSFPAGNLTVDGLRFLSTEQALADYAYFASNVVFPGLEGHDLTAASTPWIAYGGSYAGAMVAFLRKLYPDVFWGAVSSSGVTAAIEDYWQYFEPVREYGPADCIDTIQTITDIVDRILIDHPDNQTLHTQLQNAFGLKTAIKNVDFANLITSPLNAFQSRNWDPAIGAPDFMYYCNNLTSHHLLYPTPSPQKKAVRDLIEIAGYEPSRGLTTAFLNNIGYLNLTSTPQSTSTSTATSKSTSLPKTADISWTYQVCTEWGYYVTGSSVPNSIRPLISRLIDLEYTSQFCPSVFGITTPPDTDRINQYGGLDFSYPRVALIGGLADPWRDATPHADGAKARQSTDSEPFILSDLAAEEVWDGIRGSVHHWDQNGLSAEQWAEGQRPPRGIVELQGEVVRFVGVWLREWRGKLGRMVIQG